MTEVMPTHPTGDPDGWVPSSRPELSWQIATDLADWMQRGAELELDGDGAVQTAVIPGDASVRVPWPFPPLAPRRRVALRVRVEGPDGWSAWSEPVVLRCAELGIPWPAPFLRLPEPERRAQPFLVRGELGLDEVAAVTLYASARGSYRVALGGTDVDDHLFTPGWTAYQERICYETTDLTRLVAKGRNVLDARVAGAWFTELFGFDDNIRAVYGDQPAFSAVLVVEHPDGSETVHVADESWRVRGDGVLVESGLYAGETADARRYLPGEDAESEGWVAPQPDPVEVRLVPRSSPPVRATDVLPVRETSSTPSGAVLLDFGQNLVGHLRITVDGPAGTTVTLRHAEVLEHGELGTRPLRRASATDRYTLRGGGPETWEPEFTFHGFRYAEVTGWPGEFDPAAVTAVVVHSDMRRTGWFESSHPLLDRLHENIVWGMRGNFLSVPTDCPQRDERMGWTGDIQVFSPTAAFLYDCDSFLASWLEDLALEQQTSGTVPVVVPNVVPFPPMPSAAWGDAAVVVPLALYDAFGDTAVLAAQYDSMRAWVDQLLEIAGERCLWEGDFQFGDWLDPDAPPNDPGKAKTDPDLVASAYLFRSTQLLARAAEALGHADDAAHYGSRAEEVRRAWVAEYVTPAGRMVSDAPTAYALAIAFDLADTPLRPALGARLAELVRRNRYRVGTGFVGTPLVAGALAATGQTAAAGRLLLQTENPGWLHQVLLGATTVWERWDSLLDDLTINPGGMTSFNHYALGAIAQWLHEGVAGLAPLEPAYRVLRIAPMPIAGLDSASVRLETPRGPAASGWRATAAGIEVSAVVPANARAVVDLPDGSRHEVGSGVHSWTVADPRLPVTTATIDPDTSLGALVDDAQALETLLAAVRAVDPGLVGMLDGNGWHDKRTLGQALMFAPPAVQQAILAGVADAGPGEVAR